MGNRVWPSIFGEKVDLFKLFFILLIFSCTKSDGQFSEEAKEFLSPYKDTFLNISTPEMAKKGPLEAIHGSVVMAPDLQKKAATEKITIGRTSYKLRNPENAPEKWLIPLLEEFKISTADNPMKGKVVRGEHFIGYVEPIYVGNLCLTCHGEKVPEALKEGILKLYPEDKAINFKLGEFRGLFWVKKSL
jgi:hypothetical protein